MRKIILTSLFIVIFLTLAFASFFYLLEIKVIDSQSGQPISEVFVKLKDLEKGRAYNGKTDKNGKVSFRIPVGEYLMVLKKEGYRPIEIPHYYTKSTRDEEKLTFKMMKGSGIVFSELTKKQIEELKKKQAEYEKFKKLKGEIKKLFDEGVKLKKEGKYDLAIEKFNEALKLNGKQPNILEHLADTYFLKGDYNSSIKYYKKALEIAPDSSELHTNLGNVYFKMGDEKNARSEFETAISKDPSKADIGYYNLGVLFLNKGDTESAASYFEKSIMVNKKYAKAYYQLGMCEINRGNYKRAKELLETYLKLAPNGKYVPQVNQILPEVEKLISNSKN